MVKELFWEILVIVCLLPYVVGSIWIVQALPVEYAYLMLVIITLVLMGVTGFGIFRIRQSGDSSLMLIVWVMCEYLFLTFTGLSISLLLGQLTPGMQAFLFLFLIINLVVIGYLIRFFIRMRRWDSPVTRHMRSELVARLINYFPTDLSTPSPNSSRFFCDSCGRETQPADLQLTRNSNGEEEYLCSFCHADRLRSSTIESIPVTPKQHQPSDKIVTP